MNYEETMNLYIYVTKDEYELPMAVADTAVELAKILGIKTSAIYCGISNEKAGRWPSRYKKVVIDDADFCDNMPECNSVISDGLLRTNGDSRRREDEK